MARIRNWKKFQHYQYRRPLWIKLYRELLDDKEWHALSGESAKGLMMLWLVAADYEGELPDSKTLAFRLRIPENKVNTLLSECSAWLEDSASNTLAEGYHSATPEKSRVETEKREPSAQFKSNPARVALTEREEFSRAQFEIFWIAYPNKIDRDVAFRQWLTLSPIDQSKAAECVPAWAKCEQWQEARYIPSPVKFLKLRRWEAHPPKNGNGGSNGKRKFGSETTQDHIDRLGRINDVFFGPSNPKRPS